MKIKYTLNEIKPQVFLLDFDDRYDAGMSFLRFQEYYESPNPKFRGKSFTIFEFMKWYSQAYGNGTFSYPKDFCGFNIPGYIIADALNHMDERPNEYDHFMSKIDDDIGKSVQNYYLIGVSESNQKTIDHELAHAYFYLNSKYRKDMKKLVADLPAKTRDGIFAELKKMMYDKKFYIDECQAYLSTSVIDFFDTKVSEKHWNKFQELFNSYNTR